jgi:hypothetical protein
MGDVTGEGDGHGPRSSKRRPERAGGGYRPVDLFCGSQKVAIFGKSSDTASKTGDVALANGRVGPRGKQAGKGQAGKEGLTQPRFERFETVDIIKPNGGGRCL